MNTKVINISIPNNLLSQADLIAQKEYRNRSELFREALRNYILSRKKMASIYSYGANQAKKNKISPQDLNKVISDYRIGK